MRLFSSKIAMLPSSMDVSSIVGRNREIARSSSTMLASAFQHNTTSGVIKDQKHLVTKAYMTRSNNTQSNTTLSTRLQPFSSTMANTSTYTEFETSSVPEFETSSEPSPGSPFHYAFPVHSLQKAKEFYGVVLGCQEGRSSDKWQDYSLHGHQIVCHWVGNDYRCIDYYNPVDGDEVPVPHAGLALTVDQFHNLAARLKSNGIKFIIEPHLRFEGQPGEQYTMFFKDPSGNNLEFKAMTRPQNLFAKYNVPPE